MQNNAVLVKAVTKQMLLVMVGRWECTVNVNHVIPSHVSGLFLNCLS
jgi:hypothetical protein